MIYKDIVKFGLIVKSVEVLGKIMPFQRLHIQKHSNSFITNFVVCLLISKSKNEDLLDEAIAKLFADLRTFRKYKIIQELLITNKLKAARENEFVYLMESINSKLRPKLLKYAESNREGYKNSFLSKFGSEEDLDKRIKLLGTPESPPDDFEQKVLSDFMSAKINIIEGEHSELDDSNSDPNTLYFSHHNGKYYFFVKTEFVPEKWLETLPPPIEQPDLPKEIEPETVISELSFQNDPNYKLFSNDQALKSILLDLRKVNLARNFEYKIVVIQPEAECDGDKQTIYVKHKEGGILCHAYSDEGYYRNSRLKFLAYKDFISEKDLKTALPITNEKLQKYSYAIEKKLAEDGIIKIKENKIGDASSWFYSMSYSAGAGLCCASILSYIVLGLTSINLATYFILEASIFVLVMTFAIIGKYQAIQYENTLSEANDLLLKNDYKQASTLVNKSIDKSLFFRGARRLFLTEEHGILMNFFVGLCAEDECDIKKAYKHYMLSYEAAKKNEKDKSVSICALKLMMLIENNQEELSHKFKNKDETIKNIKKSSKVIRIIFNENSELSGQFFLVGTGSDSSIKSKEFILKTRREDMEYNIANQEMTKHSGGTTAHETHASQVDSSIKDIGSGMVAYSETISLQSRIDKIIQDESGRPTVLDYKFLPSSASGRIKIGIKCKFRFLDIPNKEIAIEIPSLSLLGTPVYEKKQDVLDNCKEKKESIFGSLFIWSKPTFEDALRAAESTQGVAYESIEKFQDAYRLARTDKERTYIIECLVNRHADLESYLTSKRLTSFIIIDSRWTSSYSKSEVDVARGDVAYIDRAAIKPQERYLGCLPNNYFSNSESANKIISEYNEIFKLLEEQNIDAAWDIFRPYATQEIKLSPFIVKAFSHIQAATHLLNVVFRISRHAEYYGQKEAALRISEQGIILTANKELKRACDLLTFNPEQQNFIETNGINPTATLLEYGADQAKNTPYNQLILGRNKQVEWVRENIEKYKASPSNRLPGQYDNIPSTKLLPVLPAIEEITEEEPSFGM